MYLVCCRLLYKTNIMTQSILHSYHNTIRHPFPTRRSSDLAERHGAAAEVVEHPARGAHDQVAAAGQPFELPAHPRPAVHRHGPELPARGQLLRLGRSEEHTS